MNSRRKGKRGQLAAIRLLQERDWQVWETTPGKSTEDVLAVSPGGILHSIEIKAGKLIDVPRFVSQAQRQSRDHRGATRWMLIAHIHGTQSYLVLRQDDRPVVWHAKEVTPDTVTVDSRDRAPMDKSQSAGGGTTKGLSGDVDTCDLAGSRIAGDTTITRRRPRRGNCEEEQ